MTDLETKVRDHLRGRAFAYLESRAAEAGTPRLPDSLARRIRVREAMTAAAVALAIVGVVAGGFAAGRLLPGTGVAPSGPSPVATPSFGPWPDVTFGGAHTPYVGHTAGEDRFVELPKVVLAYGTVEGQWWSYTGFESRGTGDYVDGAYSNVPEPCAELMFDSTGSGGADCLDPPTSDLQVDTQSFDATGAGGQPAPLPALAVLGVVSPGVDHVVVTLLDGQSRTLVLLDGPPGVPAKYFVLFIPPSDQAVLGPLGHVSAFGADGTALATQTVCQPGDGALCVSDAP